MGALNLRLIEMTSLVMIAFRLAARSMKVPTSFSSTRMAFARVSGSSMKSLEKSVSAIEA